MCQQREIGLGAEREREVMVMVLCFAHVSFSFFYFSLPFFSIFPFLFCPFFFSFSISWWSLYPNLGEENETKKQKQKGIFLYNRWTLRLESGLSCSGPERGLYITHSLVVFIVEGEVLVLVTVVLFAQWLPEYSRIYISIVLLLSTESPYHDKTA